jgi:hypothetical protein
MKVNSEDEGHHPSTHLVIAALDDFCLLETHQRHVQSSLPGYPCMGRDCNITSVGSPKLTYTRTACNPQNPMTC